MTYGFGMVQAGADLEEVVAWSFPVCLEVGSQDWRAGSLAMIAKRCQLIVDWLEHCEDLLQQRKRW